MTGYEVESKVELNRSDFERLLESGSICQRVDQLNVYYDSDGALSRSSATFRMRFTSTAEAVMTLKIPVRTVEGPRECVEIEQPLRGCAFKTPLKEMDVRSDLPTEFVAPLCRLGVERLERVGWMRTRRWVLRLLDDLTVELDQVQLPGGHLFFEAEVEDDRPEVHKRAIELIRKLALSARPSLLSKYERFFQALTGDIESSCLRRFSGADG